MGTALDDAYFKSSDCTNYEPLLGKLVTAVNLLEKRIRDIPSGGSISIDVGKTKTLEAGNNAYVVNTGTNTNAILEFGIPKGDNGKSVKNVEINDNGHLIITIEE